MLMSPLQKNYFCKKNAPSLEMFKVRLDEALRSLVWWVAPLPMVRELELDDLYPFQPKAFCKKRSGPQCMKC